MEHLSLFYGLKKRGQYFCRYLDITPSMQGRAAPSAACWALDLRGLLSVLLHPKEAKERSGATSVVTLC